MSHFLFCNAPFLKILLIFSDMLSFDMRVPITMIMLTTNVYPYIG
jgi:hypothetical protein